MGVRGTQTHLLFGNNNAPAITVTYMCMARELLHSYSLTPPPRVLEVLRLLLP